MGADAVACDTAGGVGDFLWSKSSDFFLTSLPQLLSRHRRQMMLLVVRDLTVPHHEDDLQPLGAQRPQRRMMIVAPRPLLIVVGPAPLTLAPPEKRNLIDDVAQRLVTGEAEPNDPLLAAPDRHGYAASMPLEVLPRLPPLRGVPQKGPERRCRDTVVTDRERSDPLRLRQACEKSVDRLSILANGRHDRGQFLHQGQHQPSLAPDHMVRHRQLRPLEDSPELFSPGAA